MIQSATPSRRRELLISAATLIAGLGVYLGTAVAALALSRDPVMSMAAANLVILVAVLLWRHLTTSGKEAIVHDRRPAEEYSPSFWPLAALGLLVCWVVGQVLAMWIYQMLGSAGFDASAQSRQDANPALLLAMMLVLAPAGEEALMRGLVYPVLRRNWSSPVGAAVVTSVIFAVLHTNLVQIVLTVPLGILLAFVYERTRKLWPVMAMHLVFNLFSIIVPAASITRIVESPGLMAPVVIIGTMIATSTLYMLHPSKTHRPEG